MGGGRGAPPSRKARQAKPGPRGKRARGGGKHTPSRDPQGAPRSTRGRPRPGEQGNQEGQTLRVEVWLPNKVCRACCNYYKKYTFKSG